MGRGRLDRYGRDEWQLPNASHDSDLARIYQASDDERAELRSQQILDRTDGTAPG